jgi:uncharacterized membrane protein
MNIQKHYGNGSSFHVGDITTQNTNPFFSAFGLALIFAVCFMIIIAVCWLMFSAFTFNASTGLCVAGPSLSGLVLALSIAGLGVVILFVIFGERG